MTAPKVLMLELAEEVATTVLVHHVPGIQAVSANACIFAIGSVWQRCSNLVTCLTVAVCRDCSVVYICASSSERSNRKQMHKVPTQ